MHIWNGIINSKKHSQSSLRAQSLIYISFQITTFFEKTVYIYIYKKRLRREILAIYEA